MKILAIETSCDDTCISIMEVHPAKAGRGKRDLRNATFRVLANNSNSQIKIHIPYGGVYPVLAKREHQKNLPIILDASLRQAKLHKKIKPIDAIAVTYGPGLEMCLWEGIIFARELAKKWKVPIIPVNHMEGHILSVFGKAKGKFSMSKINFPALALLVSGGHTELVLIKKQKNYEIIGETLDDAVGEAFDKVARMLDLPYPGGPEISRLAELQRRKEKQDSRGLRRPTGRVLSKNSAEFYAGPEKLGFSWSLPRPMLHSKDFNFSFSGLKTAVLYLTRKIGKINSKTKAQIALEFENAAIECLTFKTKGAIEKYKIRTVIVGGGVAANRHLKNEMKKVCGKKTTATAGQVKLLFPTPELATDNSIMIGIVGYLNYKKNYQQNKRKIPKPDSIKAIGNLKL
ncbi:MAG: tRNA (adenosine(37)-N6)-threonylcarbamoyltransferase complex transferase subunit TsaD [Candidatus Paceibacterota bacterium]